MNETKTQSFDLVIAAAGCSQRKWETLNVLISLQKMSF